MGPRTGLFHLSLLSFFMFMMFFSLVTTGISHVPSLLPTLHGNLRTLRGARPEARIGTRSLHGCLASDLELHYIDDASSHGDGQFVARVRMASKLPAIVLEEIEHHLDDITCSDSAVSLRFADVNSRTRLHGELSVDNDFYIVTSHAGCNKEGERAVYRVFGVHCDEAENTLVFSIKYEAWKDAAHSVTVDFGQTTERFQPRQHDSLRRRQTTTSSYTTSISFSYPPTSSPTPSATEVTKVFHEILLDKQILPWDGAAGDVVVSGPSPIGEIEIKCRECAIIGALSLLAGSFTMGTIGASDNDTDNILSFYRSGYVEMEMNGFSAYFDLETNIQPHAALKIFNANLPSIAIPGFQIAGIGAVGPLLNGQVTMGVELATDLDFVYGFRVHVPDKSSIIFDIGNLTNSSVTGFDQTKFEALPFQAHVDSLALTVSMGFSPQIVLGISVFDGHGQMGAGVAFDLPNASVTIEEVTDVDSNCNPMSGNTTDRSASGDIFHGLINIIPSLEIGAGLIDYADLVVPEIRIEDKNTWKALTTSFPLPTKCLAFDSKASTYGPPTTTTAATTVSGSAASATSTGGANVMIEKRSLAFTSLAWAFLPIFLSL